MPYHKVWSLYLLLSSTMSYLPLEQKKKLLISTKKTAGMLTKIEKMIETDTYCGDIAQQINASI